VEKKSPAESIYDLCDYNHQKESGKGFKEPARAKLGVKHFGEKKEPGDSTFGRV